MISPFQRWSASSTPQEMRCHPCGTQVSLPESSVCCHKAKLFLLLQNVIYNQVIHTLKMFLSFFIMTKIPVTDVICKWLVTITIVLQESYQKRVQDLIVMCSLLG